MTEKETLLLAGGVAVAAWLLTRKPSKTATSSAAQLAAQQSAQQQAQLAAQQAAGGQSSQTAAILAGLGQGIGSALAGIGSLTGGGSGTNKQNGGTYSYESTAVVDEYEAMPEYMYGESTTGGASGAWSGAAYGGAAGYDDGSIGVD